MNKKIINKPSKCERTYFTNKNSKIIYNRLKKELICKDFGLLSLGPYVEAGPGIVCIEENEQGFEFYVASKTLRFACYETDDIYEIIECLVQFYEEDGYITEANITDADKIREIFYDTLGLENKKVLCKKIYF